MKTMTSKLWKIRKGIAESEKTPPAILEKLAIQLFGEGEKEAQEKIEIGMSLLSNPNIPKKVLETIIKQLKSLPIYEKERDYLDIDIYLAIAFNSAISKEERNEYIQHIIARGGSGYLAENPNTPPEILAKLPISQTRYQVAENPNTPPQILRQLAQEDCRYVRSYVAKNISTPTDVIVKIAKEKDSRLSLEFYDFIYGNYKDWKGFLFDYPRMPKLELYKILLAKEKKEETTGAEKFIAKICIDIPALQSYVIENCDRSARLEIAIKRNTPLHILEKLVADPDAEVRAEVSENENLPLYCLLQLTKDEDINVRKRLVKSFRLKETPVEILEALANDEDEEIRVLVAGKDKTLAETLSQLANDTSLKVKKRLVSNVNTPTEVLDRLWREDGLFDIRNPNTPGHVLAEAIAQTKSSNDLCKLLDNPVKGSQIPASTLEDLASHKDPSVRSRVAEHPNTASSVLVKLADDEYQVTRWGVASSPNTPPYILEQLLSKWEYSNGKIDNELCRRLAHREDAPAFVLEYLAENESFWTRKAVAYNPSTPLSALGKLALTESRYLILSSLSQNPSINSEVLMQLAQNPQTEGRLYTIDRSQMTLEIWQKLARDESAEVREAIAAKSNSTTTRRLTTIKGEVLNTTVIQHPHLPLELWQELATDSEVKVRQGAAINPDAPISILELLAVDEKSEVRQKLADNSNLPVSILERLGMDISAAVREVVAKSDRAPIKLLEQLALDEKREIMQALIDNPNTPASVRQTLRYRLRSKISPTLRGLSRLYDPETDDLATILSEYVTSSVPFVRLISLMHPLTPIPCLEVGAKSTFWWERYAVAVNPATPVELRQKLAEDSHDIVKVAALNSRLG